MERGLDPDDYTQAVAVVVGLLKSYPVPPEDDGPLSADDRRLGWSRKRILKKLDSTVTEPLVVFDWRKVSDILREHPEVRLIGEGRRWARWTHVDHIPEGDPRHLEDAIDKAFANQGRWELDEVAVDNGRPMMRDGSLTLTGLMYDAGIQASFRVTCPKRVVEAVDAWLNEPPLDRAALARKRIEEFSPEQLESWIAQANSRSELIVSLVGILGRPQS